MKQSNRREWAVVAVAVSTFIWKMWMNPGRCERIRSRQKQNGKDLGARQKKELQKYWGEEEKIMGWAVGVRIIAWCLYLR
jgi:hypothetical protein